MRRNAPVDLHLHIANAREIPLNISRCSARITRRLLGKRIGPVYDIPQHWLVRGRMSPRMVKSLQWNNIQISEVECIQVRFETTDYE